MKRLLVFVVGMSLLHLPIAHASAQGAIALTGGVNLASLSVGGLGPVSPDLESVTRLSIGLAATIPLSGDFGIEVGGAYSRKGGRFEEDQSLTLRMDYFEFTALGKATLPLAENRLRAYVLAGPALARKSSCDTARSTTFGDSPPIDVVRPCDEDNFHGWDLGVAAGGGLEIGLSDELGITLGVLYSHGLKNIQRQGEGHMKHRVLTVRVGLVYSIG